MKIDIEKEPEPPNEIRQFQSKTKNYRPGGVEDTEADTVVP